MENKKDEYYVSKDMYFLLDTLISFLRNEYQFTDTSKLLYYLSNNDELLQVKSIDGNPRYDSVLNKILLDKYDIIKYYELINISRNSQKNLKYIKDLNLFIKYPAKRLIDVPIIKFNDKVELINILVQFYKQCEPGMCSSIIYLNIMNFANYIGFELDLDLIYEALDDLDFHKEELAYVNYPEFDQTFNGIRLSGSTENIVYINNKSNIEIAIHNLNNFVINESSGYLKYNLTKAQEEYIKNIYIDEYVDNEDNEDTKMLLTISNTDKLVKLKNNVLYDNDTLIANNVNNLISANNTESYLMLNKPNEIISHSNYIEPKIYNHKFRSLNYFGKLCEEVLYKFDMEDMKFILFDFIKDNSDTNTNSNSSSIDEDYNICMNYATKLFHSEYWDNCFVDEKYNNMVVNNNDEIIDIISNFKITSAFTGRDLFDVNDFSSQFEAKNHNKALLRNTNCTIFHLYEDFIEWLDDSDDEVEYTRDEASFLKYLVAYDSIDRYEHKYILINIPMEINEIVYNSYILYDSNSCRGIIGDVFMNAAIFNIHNDSNKLYGALIDSRDISKSNIHIKDDLSLTAFREESNVFDSCEYCIDTSEFVNEFGKLNIFQTNIESYRNLDLVSYNSFATSIATKMKLGKVLYNQNLLSNFTNNENANSLYKKYIEIQSLFDYERDVFSKWKNESSNNIKLIKNPYDYIEYNKYGNDKFDCTNFTVYRYSQIIDNARSMFYDKIQRWINIDIFEYSNLSSDNDDNDDDNYLIDSYEILSGFVDWNYYTDDTIFSMLNKFDGSLKDAIRIIVSCIRKPDMLFDSTYAISINSNTKFNEVEKVLIESDIVGEIMQKYSAIAKSEGYSLNLINDTIKGLGLSNNELDAWNYVDSPIEMYKSSANILDVIIINMLININVVINGGVVITNYPVKYATNRYGNNFEILKDYKVYLENSKKEK